MKKLDSAVKVTLFANRLVALVLLVLVFTLPWLLDWYCKFRVLTALERTAEGDSLRRLRIKESLFPAQRFIHTHGSLHQPSCSGQGNGLA